MSDELKIELQVESNTDKAESQLNELIEKFKKRKPIELDVRLGNVNLEEFTQSIKSITTNLNSLASLNFNNLDKAEESLRKISSLVKNFNGLDNKNNSSSIDKKSNSLFDSLGEFTDNEKLERLSKDQKEALNQVKSLQNSAEFLKKAILHYKSSLNEAEKAFKNDNKVIFSDIDSYEKMFDTAVFKRLVKYKKELNEVEKEYRNLGVELADMEKLTNEKYDGTMATRKYQEYVNVLELDADKFKIAVERAKELNKRKWQLTKNLKNNLEKASEDEQAAFKVLETMYKEVPKIDTSESDRIRNTLAMVLEDDLFRLDFSDLDFRLEEDFRKGFDRFFDLLKEVQDEYNDKFKSVDGFEEIDIFNVEGLGKESEKLEKEVKKTLEVVDDLKGLGEGTLNRLGLDSDSLNVFETLDNSVKSLEDRLSSLKEKFSGAFEISNESSQALQKIKDALLEINKLSEEQKQVFFDFGLDTDKIKKAKQEAEDLKVASESVADVSFDGLIESYSRLESASGEAIREIEKLRLSSTRSVTLKYGYEEDEDGVRSERVLQTAEFNDNISKRTKELINEYTKASRDLIKAQKEYYEAVNGGKSSEETIKKLSENVKVMELNLGNIKKNVTDLENYPEVMEAVFESFGKLDDIRYRQSETDALKIIDKANLVEANTLLKESKTLIDSISKDSVQLQKDLNAGYKETRDKLEASIRSKEAQLTNNISKLINIPNSKAAIDQIFSYQLAKAQKTEIDIQRIKDKANKTTGTKIVDEQDEYLKSYKRYLTELKAIEKSLSTEKNESARADKILQLDNTFKELDKIKSKLNEVKSKVANELFDKTMRELDLSFASNFSKTYSELDKIEEKINKLSKSNYADKAVVSSVQDTIKGLRDSLNVDFKDLSPKDLSAILVKVEELKKVAKDIDLDIKLSKDSEKIEIFIKGVTDQLDVLQSMADGVDISHITRQFKDLVAGSDRNSVVMKSINDDVKTLEKSLKKAGDTASHTGISFKGFFSDIGDSLRTFTLGEIIGDVITDSLYQTWDIIKEMDSAMSNLKKVADLSDINTEDKLDSIRSQAIDVAKEVGMASSEVINAIADTLQAGIGTMEESIRVARSSMILANVGDMSQEAASEAVNTIINGYKLKPLKEINVEVSGLTTKTTELANAMDLLNYAGNNYAIGVDGVAEAMKRGGTVLSQYGVSLEDSIGLITAANEAIQDPAKVGNALKTISINMAGVKSNASKGTLELNKTAKTLKEIAGIDVYSDKATGEIKGMVEILDELNQKLKEGKLNQDEFLAISEALAGKENAAVLQSLLGNYETFKQIQGEFAEGLHFGSAEKENAAYVDSLNGKLNQLKEVWIDTLMVLADSSSVKGLLDVFISVSEGINTFIKALDKTSFTLPTIFGLIGGGSSYFKTFSSSIESAKEAGIELGSGLTGIKNTVATGVVPAIKNFVKQGLLIGGVTLAVQLGTKAWDELSNGVKNAADKLQTIEDEQLANISNQNKKIESLQTIGVEYEKIANKANRTAEEEAEMLRLGNELALILPEMVIDYDENGNAILNMTDDMQGLIDKTKEANEQYNRLLLGTRIEQSDNALKMLTKGEIFGKDSKGLVDQKIQIEESYNKKMKDLQKEYILQIENVRNYEGKNREIALENAKRIRNQMLTEESKYMTEYSAIQSRIVEQGNIFRDEMESTWRESTNYLSKELTPELEKSIKTFTNSLDFTEINSEEELEAVRRIFRDIPKLAQDGAVDIEDLNSKITKINEEFSKTGDLDTYNKQMQELAKTVSKDTGWDTSVLKELFTVITDGTLESSSSLSTFLSNYGKTVQDIRNGDSLAKALQEQYNAIEHAINTIANHDFKSEVANYQLRLKLQSDEDIPKQVRDTVNKMVNLGLEDVEIITVASEILLTLKDGKIDEGEAELLKNQLHNTLKDKISSDDLELVINGIIESFNTEEVVKDIENRLSNEKVEKEVGIKIDTNAIDNAKKLLKERELLVELEAVVKSEEDFVYFAQIIEKLPTNKDYTYKFISENKEALAELESYQEVLDYIKQNPEFIQTYKLNVDKLDLSKKEIEELNKEIDSANGKEVKVTATNDNILQTIEDVETLIKISSEVEKGKYKIEIDANTQQAIDNVELLKTSFEGLSGVLSNMQTSTVTVETAQAAKNITGLKNRIDELNSKKSNVFTYRSETAQAAKNITGLINKVNEIKKLTGKTFRYYAVTAQAAKNISGLITRVDQLNQRNGKTFTWNASTAQAAKNITGLINKIDQINGKKAKTFSYTTNVKTETVSLDNVANSVPSESDLVSPISTVADNIASQTSNIQASLRTGIGEINSFSSNMARATTRTPIALGGNNIYNSIKYNIELLQEMDNRINKVANSVSLLGKQMDDAVGYSKINYLKQQNELYKEQLSLQDELKGYLEYQQGYYKEYLNRNGFVFNADGNLINYEEGLLALKQEEARLKDLADEASKRQSDYSGDDENYKKQLKSAYDTAKDKADKYSESVSEITEHLNNYINITFTELPKVAEEWQELQNLINETSSEIINATIAANNFKFDIGAKKFEAEIKDVTNAINLLDKQLIYAVGDRKDRLFENKINLLREQQQQLHILANQYRAAAKNIGEFLGSYGFNMDSNGFITNIEHLEQLKDSNVYSEINEQLERYLELTQDKIPSLSVEWWSVQETIDQTRISILEAKDELSDITLDVNVTKLNKALKSIQTEISKIEREINNSFGTKKESLLSDKINSLRQEQNKLHELANAYRVQRKEISDFLNVQGFVFDTDGSIINQHDIINYKNDPALMQYLQGLIDKYHSLTNTIDGFSQEWWVVQDSINATQSQIEEARKELEKFLNVAKVDALLDRFNDLSNTLDIIDKKLEYANGRDKLDLLSQKLAIIKQQQLELEKQEDFYSNKKYSLQSDLKGLGFKFDYSGNITNYVNQLERVANSSQDFDEVKSKLEEYLDIQDNKLPSIEKSWLDFENTYKDVLKEQLDTTKDIEEKITDIYKKQVKDRIEALNKEADAKIESLNKQKEAYNKYRDEVDYKNDYNEKLEEVTNLQNKLDIAMRDTSLSGQKKVLELQKELAQAQKELQKLTQDKIDENINDMFDKEADRIEEENTTAIENLEKEWSDSKIAELVSKALGSGVFTDIEGNVVKLEDALVNFSKESGELFGVLGSTIKSELITNLEIARDTVESLSSIMRELDLTEYATSVNYRSVDEVSSKTRSIDSQYSSTNNNVNITAPIINIEGNVDSDVVEELKDISEKIKSDIIAAIAGSIR